jgi:hypothetical protein
MDFEQPRALLEKFMGKKLGQENESETARNTEL